MVNNSSILKSKTIMCLLIVLLVCSCKQQPSKGKIQHDNKQNLLSKSGLLFERGLNRGSGYTDSFGIDYSLRYAPITITNDSTIPIHIEIAFSTEYDYPTVYGDKKFKIIPLPKEWAQNGTTDRKFDSMFAKLPNYIAKPLLNNTIKPGEQIAVAIGTLVPEPRNISINLNAPFANMGVGLYFNCDWQMTQEASSNQEIALGLKLDINEICIVIPCGKITYPMQ